MIRKMPREQGSRPQKSLARVTSELPLGCGGVRSAMAIGQVQVPDTPVPAPVTGGRGRDGARGGRLTGAAGRIPGTATGTAAAASWPGLLPGQASHAVAYMRRPVVVAHGTDIVVTDLAGLPGAS